MMPQLPRVGIDVVDIDRLRLQMEQTPAFAERIFTAAERAYCERRRRRRMAHYAARFGAKEAVFKALGTGWIGDLLWTDVEVVLDRLGAPEVRLHGATRRLATDEGVSNAAISLSHARDVAIAVVLLYGTSRATPDAEEDSWKPPRV